MLRIHVPNERPFFGRIESVRGLGAMAVAAYHISGWTLHGTPLLPTGVEKWIPAHAALMAFFVISGFVLRVALAHGPQGIAPASVKFVVSRAFRVYPIIFLAVGLAAVFPMCQAGTPSVRDFTLQQWIENLLLIDASVNGTLWALQVEMLMVPAILALYFAERSLGPNALRAIAIVTTGLAFIPTWAGWPPLSANFYSFVLGMMIPTIGKRIANRGSTLTGNAGSLVCLGFFLLPGPLLGTYSLFSAILEAYSAFVLVSYLSYRSDLIISKAMDLKSLQWLGLSTGSYYVLHMATIQPMMGLANSLPLPASAGLGVLVLWLAALVPLCRASYKLVEAQGIAAGKWVNRKLQPPRRQEAEVGFVQTLRTAA